MILVEVGACFVRPSSNPQRSEGHTTAPTTDCIKAVLGSTEPDDPGMMDDPMPHDPAMPMMMDGAENAETKTAEEQAVIAMRLRKAKALALQMSNI